MLADSHIHLSSIVFDGEPLCVSALQKEKYQIERLSRDDLIKKCKEMGIRFCIEPGIDLHSNFCLLELTKADPAYIYPAVGIHPTSAGSLHYRERKTIEKLLNQNKNVVAVGETGLDYHVPRQNGLHRLRQMLFFSYQIRLAYKNKLPLILHIRCADRDAVRILRLHKKMLDNGGVVHCFKGNVDLAHRYIEEFGFHLGIGGALLQQNCTDLEETVRNVPLKWLIVESDGPFVKPQRPLYISGKKWKKGKNTSLILHNVVERIAEIKGMDRETTERIIYENTKELFRINEI